MPAIREKYEKKVASIFRSKREGVKELKSQLEQSKQVGISNVPVDLINTLKPLLKGKDVKIIFPIDEKPDRDIEMLGQIAFTKARIYEDYKGTDANVGAIFLPNKIYTIIWIKDRILEIDTLEYNKCVSCMNHMFGMGWRYWAAFNRTSH